VLAPASTYVVSTTNNVSRPWGYIYSPTFRRLPAFFDRLPGIRYSLSRHTSTLRGCLTKAARVSASGSVFSNTLHLILITALNSRFMSSSRTLPLAEVKNASIPLTHTLCINTTSALSRRANSFSRPYLLVFCFFITCFRSPDDQQEENFFDLFSSDVAWRALRNP